MVDYDKLDSFLKNGGYIIQQNRLFFVFNERDYFIENDENNPSPTPVQEFAINDDYMDLIVTGDFCSWKILKKNCLSDINFNGIWFSRKFTINIDVKLKDQFKFVVKYKNAVKWIEPKHFYDNVVYNNGCVNLEIRD